jgi:glutamate racemase
MAFALALVLLFAFCSNCRPVGAVQLGEDALPTEHTPIRPAKSPLDATGSPVEVEAAGEDATADDAELRIAEDTSEAVVADGEKASAEKVASSQAVALPGWLHEESKWKKPDKEGHIMRDENGKQLMPIFWDKEKPTIVFTDSGIGGLSIMSTFIQKFEKKPIFASARLIFYDMNGLNKNVFLQRVESIWKMKPDILLIACNGMSKQYMETQYSQLARFPVLSMLPFGRDMWFDALEKEPDSILIMFVSPVTNRQYVPLLESKGMDKSRLQVQVCYEAIMALNEGQAPDSDKTRGVIHGCVKQAWSRMTPDQRKGNIFMGMGCTHFGWAADAWKHFMVEEGADRDKVTVLNPNDDMADYLFDKYPKKQTPPTSKEGVQVRVHLGNQFKHVDLSAMKKLVVKPLASAISAAQKR